MEKYEFKLRKIITNTVEVEADNYNQALVEMFNLLLFGDKKIFEESEEKNINFDIILEKINCENDIKSIQKVKEILHNLQQKDDNFSINIGKKDDSFGKVICEKCGNCIELDEDFMS